MNDDPLSGPATSFVTPVSIRPNIDCEPDLFFDGNRFMKYLNETYDNFDVATFSISKSVVCGAPLHKIDRLIYGLKQRGNNVKPKQKKYIMNNHVKLFICYHLPVLEDENAYTDVYLGSQNLTHGTNLNIMYRVRDEHVKPLMEFFEQLWKSI